MKVLITGASGRLGPFVVRALESDYELVLFSRSQPAEGYDGHLWIQGDLNSFGDCRRAVTGCGAIVHLGAMSYPTDHPTASREAQTLGHDLPPFDATMRTNVMGTYYLLMAAQEAGVHTVVMAGSNCVLGHGYRISDRPYQIEYLPIDERHPNRPEDSYSLSKVIGEEMLAAFTRAYGLRTYALRAAGIFPPERQRQHAENIRPTRAWSDWLWAWVDSRAVATACRLCLEATDDLPPHDVFFVNADDTLVLEPSPELVARFRPELAEQAQHLQGRQSFISNAKIKGTLGWDHPYAWTDYLPAGWQARENPV